MSEPIPAVIAEHIRAINAFDTDAIVRTFAPDALVNDNRREIAGPDAIRRWVERRSSVTKLRWRFGKSWSVEAARSFVLAMTVSMTRPTCPPS